ncbi:MAG: hypothetical protein QOG31_214 [Thermoplasmata archaeon]|jgi:hypothetical protein|nr:hypothetical protein [Thermoplasmata archaeon]
MGEYTFLDFYRLTGVRVDGADPMGQATSQLASLRSGAQSPQTAGGVLALQEFLAGKAKITGYASSADYYADAAQSGGGTSFWTAIARAQAGQAAASLAPGGSSSSAATPAGRVGLWLLGGLAAVAALVALSRRDA